MNLCRSAGPHPRFDLGTAVKKGPILPVQGISISISLVNQARPDRTLLFSSPFLVQLLAENWRASPEPRVYYSANRRCRPTPVARRLSVPSDGRESRNALSSKRVGASHEVLPAGGLIQEATAMVVAMRCPEMQTRRRVPRCWIPVAAIRPGRRRSLSPCKSLVFG